MYIIHTTPRAQLVSQQKSEGSMRQATGKTFVNGTSPDCVTLTATSSARAAGRWPWPEGEVMDEASPWTRNRSWFSS